MLSFTAIGRLGRIDRLKGDPLIVRLSVACDRLIDGPSGKWTKTEWLGAVCFDAGLNQQLTDALAAGDMVEISGRIEPRKRQLGEVSVTDHSFILERFNLISRPKARKEEQAA